VPSQCWPIPTSTLYFANYLLAAIYEGVLLIMVAIKGYNARNEGHIDSRLFHAVYMNGIMYYIYLFALSVINIVIHMHAPRYYRDVLSLYQQIMHSLLANRMMLQIRACGKQNVHGDDFEDFNSASVLPIDPLVFENANNPGVRPTLSFHTEDVC